jgi:hypothetical protein
VESNGQGLSVSPQAMIDSLMARVQQLTMENVMLQAAINQLQTKEDDSGDPVREGEMVHSDDGPQS